MTKNFSFSIIAKYLAICILMCFAAENASAQRSKSNKNKDDKDKKEYPKTVKVWTLDEDYSIKDYSQEYDTSLHLFQNYDYNDKGSISYSNLGNMGTPYIYNIFDDREQARTSPVVFFNAIDDFVSKPEETKFYQVNHPYTWLYYCTTPKARNGQVIDFTHSQNVTKRFNWGFNIGLVGSTGRISHQHARNTTFSPQMSYVGKHLSVHFFYNFTKSYIEENGGVVDTIEVNANRFTTKMSDPYSDWGRRTWNLVAEYSIGKTDFNIINDSTRTEIYTPRLTFGYVWQYDKLFRSYTDAELIDEVNGSNRFLDNKITYDSLFYRKMTNRFHLKIAENQLLGVSPGLKGSIGMENELYYNFRSYVANNNETTYGNAFFEGGIMKNKSRNLILNGNYKQYLSGYKAGDMQVKGDLGLKFYQGESDTVKAYFKANITFLNQEPTYFEKHYFSNYYRWDQNFKKMQTTRIGAEFALPLWHFKIGASNYLLNNYVYFNSEGVPQQYSKPITVQSVSLMKDFFLWHVRFANRITYQHSTENKILNLPDLSLYHSTYFEFYLVKNVLLTQLGGEVHWSTEYDAFGYAPATSVFYPLRRSKAGEYPLLNGFANIKIRGVLMFFKWENIGDGLIRDWYYSADDYPYQDFHFMFGILWRFGD